MATSASAVTRMRSPSTSYLEPARRAGRRRPPTATSRAGPRTPPPGRRGCLAASRTRRGDDQAHRRPGRIEAGRHPEDAAGQVGDRAAAELAGQLGDHLLEDAAGLGRGDEDDPQADRLVRHRGEGGGQLGAPGRLEVADAFHGLRRPRHDGVVDGRAGREHRTATIGRLRRRAGGRSRAASAPGLSGTTTTGGPGRSSRLTTTYDLPAHRACFSPSDQAEQELGPLGDRAGRPIAGQAGRQRPDVEPGQVELHDGQDVRIDERGDRPGPGIVSGGCRRLAQDASSEQQRSSAWVFLPGEMGRGTRSADRWAATTDHRASFSS